MSVNDITVNGIIRKHKAEIAVLLAEIESMKRTSEVDKAFYELTVAQRNAAWHELDQWKAAAL